MSYDIIGDIHGHSDKLEALLKKMGYRRRNRAWRHPQHKAIFVGDFIDRGATGVEVVQTVRAMVDAGSALAVMGNHELNAIAWHLGLRPDNDKNRRQHEAFLQQVESRAALHRELIDWFITLPLWLDNDEFRVVHACWHGPFIEWLSPRLSNGRYLTKDLMPAACDEPADEAEKDNGRPSVFKAVEALTKGIEIPLPAPHRFIDKDGIERNRVRVRWWDVAAATYSQIALMSDAERKALPEVAVPAHARLADAAAKPTFFGHYWMTGAPQPQSATAVCVDYSAGKNGPLVAYRWDGAGPLSARQFVLAG